jgi:hypothetical protein
VLYWFNSSWRYYYASVPHDAVGKPPCQLLRKKAAKKAYWHDDTKNGENIKGILLVEAGGERGSQGGFRLALSYRF